MAAARVPRFCAAISPIDNFAMNPTFSISRSLPSRPRVPSITCRARRPLPIAKLPARNFSATAASASDSIQPPLQQEAEANRQQEEMLEGSKPDSEHTTSDGHPAPTARPSSSDPNAPMTEPTPKAPTTPSKSRSPSVKPTKSDRAFLETSRRITGTVIRTYTMAKTVAVSTNRQHFDRFLQKHHTKPSKTLVHDPKETLVEGDVIEYGLFPPVERAERIQQGKGKRVKYVLRGVVTPFGAPLDQRVPRAGTGREGLKS